MTHTVKLKKRYPPDGDKRHWVWVLRYWSADAAKETGEVIGWYAPARDRWRPRWCKGPRLTEKQAQEIRSQRRNELREGRVGQPESAQDEERPDPSSGPFSQWIEAYVEETHGTVSETTLQEIRQALHMLQEIAKPASAEAVNHTTVKRFIQARLRSGVKRSTVWKQISSLRRVWYDARIDLNPWAQPKLRRQLKSIPKDWHWYNTEEFHRLVTKCDEWREREDTAGRDGRKWLRFKGMITVAHTAGLRIGEINHLTWADVNLDTDKIEVGPNDASDTTLAWGPKDHERRVTPLTPMAKAILQELLKRPVAENPYVFVSAERHAYILQLAAVGKWRERRPLINNIRRDFLALCKAAKVPLCTFHSLRKSCCTNLLEGGVAPHAVQKIMGHASIETTIKYYSKVRRDQIAVAREVAESYATQRRPVRTSGVKSA